MSADIGPDNATPLNLSGSAFPKDISTNDKGPGFAITGGGAPGLAAPGFPAPASGPAIGLRPASPSEPAAVPALAVALPAARPPGPDSVFFDDEQVKLFIASCSEQLNKLSSDRKKLKKAKQLISDHFRVPLDQIPITDSEILNAITIDFPDIDTIDRGYESEE
jgi:hypothetical protein